MGEGHVWNLNGQTLRCATKAAQYFSTPPLQRSYTDLHTLQYSISDLFFVGQWVRIDGKHLQRYGAISVLPSVFRLFRLRLFHSRNHVPRVTELNSFQSSHI